MTGKKHNSNSKPAMTFGELARWVINQSRKDNAQLDAEVFFVIGDRSYAIRDVKITNATGTVVGDVNTRGTDAFVKLTND